MTRPLRSELHRAVDAVADQGWDALLDGRDLYVSTTWLRLVTRSFAAEQPGYVVVRDGDDAVAGLVLYRVDSASVPSPFYRLDRILARLATAGPEGVSSDDEMPDEAGDLLPSLMLGGRRTSHSGIAVRSRDPEQGRAAVEAAVLAAEQEARRTGARTAAFPYVDADDTTLRAILVERGWLEFPAGTCSLLVTGGGSFDDYLHRFSRDRRSQFKRDEAQIRRAGFELHRERMTPHLAAELAPLEVQMHERHGSFKTQDESRTAMTVLGELFGDAATFVTARDEAGRCGGFVGLLQWRGHLHGRHAGFDYSLKRNVPVYFPTVFYEPVRLAHELGASVIDYSLGTAEAKRSRGCVALAQVGYARAFDPPAATTLAHLVAAVHGRSAAGAGEDAASKSA